MLRVRICARSVVVARRLESSEQNLGSTANPTGIESMCRRARTRVVSGTALIALLLVLSPSLSAAEFRTTVRGKSMVRAVNYQQVVEEYTPIEELAPVEAMPLEPYRSSRSGDCCGNARCDGRCGGGCYGRCGGRSGMCGHGWTYWGSVEFLLWWRQGQNLPPLVTTSPTTTSQELAGVLGVPGTEVLYATETQSGDARPGGRLTLGIWFDSCQFSGIGARLYSLGESTANYDQDSTVVPVLARPFYNVELGAQDAVLFAYPNSTSGSISVRNTSRVSGGDVFMRRLFFQDGRHRIDLIAGYQFARIDTDLAVASNLEATGTSGSIPLGTQLQVADWFDTRNSYHAGEIGFWGVMDRGPVTWSLLAKVGLGNMSQRTEIAGQTITAIPNTTPTVTNQGLLAMNSNSGVFKSNVFTVSPEVALTGAYHLSNSVDLTFGYSFIMWNHVAQVADQIDTSVNPTQLSGNLVGPALPAFPDNDDSYIVHGLNFGIQWIW